MTNGELNKGISLTKDIEKWEKVLAGWNHINQHRDDVTVSYRWHGTQHCNLSSETLNIMIILEITKLKNKIEKLKTEFSLLGGGK